MYSTSILESLGFHARVASVVGPFLLAMALRLMLGKSRFTSWCVTLGTMWFAINVLLAPYSPAAQYEIGKLWGLFR